MTADTEAICNSIIRRIEIVSKFRDDEKRQQVAKAHCTADPVTFFNDFCWTFDPRVATRGLSAYMPFDLFPRQEELVRWLDARLANAEEGLVEKSRDVGWTWVAGGYALNKWLFVPGFKTTFGSRKEDYVDKLGDIDSIFEKIRLLLYRLPVWMLPVGFNRKKHDACMLLVNPANGNTISGEAGDNMGRGGRSTLYIVDEGAFVERPERVDAAIIGNADCRIWASSANGAGNLFYRKRHSGNIPVFRFHWTDDPRKNEAWATKKKAELSSSPSKWESEYEIDYAASLEGVCIAGSWVESARQLAQLLNLPARGPGVAGLDIGAGRAKSVLTPKFGPVILMPHEWQEVDNIQTTYRALDVAHELGVKQVNYDASGIGNTVTSTLRHANTGGVIVSPVNTGLPPTDVMMPDGRSAGEWFANLKAQIWWAMRDAIKASHEHLLYLQGNEEGVPHDESELALLPNCADLIAQLSLPRWFRNEKGKIMIETKKQLAARGVASPDYADSLALDYYTGDSALVYAAV